MVSICIISAYDQTDVNCRPHYQSEFCILLIVVVVKSEKKLHSVSKCHSANIEFNVLDSLRYDTVCLNELELHV